MKKYLILLLTLATFAACKDDNGEETTTVNKETSFDLTQARQAIETTNKKMSAAMVSGDSATIVNLYHTDAKVYPSNMAAGDRVSMGAMTASMPAMGVKKFNLATSEVSGNADQLVETGTWEMGDSTKTWDKGNFMVVWKMENGEWKLWRDIWNSSNPLPGATK